MADAPIGLIEALIFASPEPVDAGRLAEVVGEINSAGVEFLIAELNGSYECEGRAFRIVRAAGGYRFATLPVYGRQVKQLVTGGNRVRLTKASLETLSIIAYRQPISRADIEGLRRVDVGGVLKLLLDRRLIKIAGRAKGAGRPLLYGTTTEFLKHFGIDSLTELPQMAELATPRKESDMPELPLIPND